MIDLFQPPAAYFSTVVAYVEYFALAVICPGSTILL